MLNIGHTVQGGITMDYKKAYSLLFRGITEALEESEKSHIISEEIINAGIILQKLQQETEKMFIEDG